MRLIIRLPHESVLDIECLKVVVESSAGSYCLLPRHIDFVARLAPGLLEYTPVAEDGERFAAVDEGFVVKCGDQVRISTRQAVLGGDLGELQQIVEQQFTVRDEWERKVRSAAARLESSLVRRFLEFSKS